MTLAALFYSKHPRRPHVRRPRRRSKVLLEPIEPRLLLSTTPVGSPFADAPTALVEPVAPPADPPAPLQSLADALTPLVADTALYPVPLQPVSPLGSLVYDPSVTGTLDVVGEIDTFTIDLDAGQTLTLRLRPDDASIVGEIRVVDPSATQIGSAT